MRVERFGLVNLANPRAGGDLVPLALRWWTEAPAFAGAHKGFGDLTNPPPYISGTRAHPNQVK
jgi:hypothetical protein